MFHKYLVLIILLGIQSCVSYSDKIEDCPNPISQTALKTNGFYYNIDDSGEIKNFSSIIFFEDGYSFFYYEPVERNTLITVDDIYKFLHERIDYQGNQKYNVVNWGVIKTYNDNSITMKNYTTGVCGAPLGCEMNTLTSSIRVIDSEKLILKDCVINLDLDDEEKYYNQDFSQFIFHKRENNFESINAIREKCS